MTRGRICKCFIGKDNNYAETMLRVLNDEYQLGIPDSSVKLVDGFGGGMGCEKACGALCGECSAISYQLIKEGAHATPESKPTVAASTEEFVERFDSDACCELVKTYKKGDTRCLDVTCIITDIADVRFKRVLSTEERR